jgi:hypothetical protein
VIGCSASGSIGPTKRSRRPEGSPEQGDSKAFAESLIDDPVYRAKLRRDLRARKVSPPIEQMLWAYAKGKPKDVVELQGGLNLVDERATDEELIAQAEAIIAKAKQYEAARTKPRS